MNGFVPSCWYKCISCRNMWRICDIEQHFLLLLVCNAVPQPLRHRVPQRGIVLCLFNLKLLDTRLITWNCFICCLFCVLYCSVTSYCSVFLFFLCVLYVSLFLYCTVSACVVRAATIIEGIPSFFLSCKANARV
jgi:hypothetical protein